MPNASKQNQPDPPRDESSLVTSGVRTKTADHDEEPITLRPPAAPITVRPTGDPITERPQGDIDTEQGDPITVRPQGDPITERPQGDPITERPQGDPVAEQLHATPSTLRSQAEPASGRYTCLEADAQDALVARRVRQMNRSYDAHDYEGALASAARVLSVAPGHPQAVAFADACQGTLERQYVAQLGGIGTVFEIAVQGPELVDLLRDPRTAFLVPIVDGDLDLGEVLDACAGRRLEALRVLVDLYGKGVIRSL